MKVMYEHQGTKPIPRRRFLQRFFGHVAVAMGVVAFSIAFGTLGYHVLDDLEWSQAFVHAATPLSGLGLSHVPTTAAGRIFAGIYALYGGLVFLLVTGIVYAPLLHRLIHRFHWDEEEAEADPRIH